MALNAGDAGCTTGLSNRMYANWIGDTVNNGLSGTPTPAQTAELKSMCYQFALAIVAEFQANGTAKIGSAVGALQKDNTAGNPATLAPGADKFLPIV